MQSIDRRRARNWIFVGALGVLVGAVVVAYPFALAAATQRLGVPGVAGMLLGLAAISFALPVWFGTQGLRSGVASGSGLALRRGVELWGGGLTSVSIPILLVAAAFSGDGLYLQLVPSAVYLTLAGWFYASLRSGDSIIERAARLLVPEAPEFIRSYCRKVTRLWSVFFAVTAIVAAVLALSGDRSSWEFVTGRLVYALMVAASLVEFLVRKTWFRYYFHGGWFDRIWGRVFPPENTAAGRRSMQHIADYWRQHNG